MNILDAVRDGNVRVLQLLVAVPGQVPQKELNQGLLAACKSGEELCVEVLLRAGANPDTSAGAGNSAMTIAIWAGHSTVVKRLVEAGANCNFGKAGRGNPLHWAAQANNAACIEVLIKVGACINCLDSEQKSPLVVAAGARAWQAMKVLVDAESKLNLVDNKGRTALHYACHKAIGVELLLSAGAAPDIADTDGNCAIHMAATEGFDRTVALLLDYGCRPDRTNCFGKTAAHYLAMKNHCDGLRAVAASGGRLNIKDADGATPLMCAMQRNRPEAVKTLLMANCQQDTLSSKDAADKLTEPLRFALQRQLFGMAKLLVLAGSELQPVYEWIDSVEKQRQAREAALAARPYIDSDEEGEEEVVDDVLEESLEWFSRWLHAPPSLQQLCRLCIRHHVGGRLLEEKDQLPTPPALRDYITLQEVEDHHVDSYLI